MEIKKGKLNEIVKEVLFIGANDGLTSWLHGDVYTVKLDKHVTNGAFSMIEASVPAGAGPPLHIHHDADEIFYLITGELDVTAGGVQYKAKAGDLIYIPKNVPHSFKNNSFHTVRQLLLFTPAGFEGFFNEAGTPAIPGLAPPPFDPDNNDHVIDVGIKYLAEQLPDPNIHGR